MTPVTLRKTLRWGHIVAALVVGAYLYSPLSANPVFAAFVLYAVFPLMAVSGVWMWKQGAIAKLFGARKS